MSGAWLSLCCYKNHFLQHFSERVVRKTKETQAWHGRLVLLLTGWNKRLRDNCCSRTGSCPPSGFTEAQLSKDSDGDHALTTGRVGKGSEHLGKLLLLLPLPPIPGRDSGLYPGTVSSQKAFSQVPRNAGTRNSSSQETFPGGQITHKHKEHKS